MICILESGVAGREWLRMADEAKHIFFSGAVQGVGFRFTAQRIALRDNLAGFVRNCPDGRVEMHVQGPEEDITDCLRDIGESFAGYIRETEIEEVPPDEKYINFQITF